jgi:large subunit ribosomal protein L24e
MVKCNFCGTEIKPGQGKIYAKKDGTTFNFCSNKCEKNQIVMKRKPTKIKWTNQYNKLKQTMITAKEHEKEKAKESN